MKKRIFLSILAACMSILVVSFFGIFLLLYQTYSDIQFDELEKQTELISGMVEETGDTYLSELDDSSYRLNWITPEGVVVYDSDHQEANMPNHLGRTEIQQAIKNGIGKTTRYSDTLAKQTYYIAQKLADGSFIRISVTMDSVYGLMGKFIWPFAALLAACIVLALILSEWLSQSIVRPILAINLDDPLSTKTYPQLVPLLERIDQSNKQIQKQMEELKVKSREFEAVSSNMDEGLILLSGNQRLLSANNAARKIFDIQENWKPPYVHKLPSAMEKAGRDGRATFSLHQNSRDYVVEVSCIFSRGIKSGYVILILDTTEKVEARNRRQEFTANVTHELKTPIQTIMASTELLANGIVRKEDESRFLKYISQECNRLVGMINDIIQLSRLDAGYEEVQEKLQLAHLIDEIVLSIQPACDARGITLATDCQPIELTGSRKTWMEILSNIIENALNYNVDGGSIHIDLHQKETGGKEQVVFQVQDTGIGIPYRYQERVFERFFRVDKSHSKSTGGSGLGLSIVYHAVEKLHGTVKLKSQVNKGTCITITVPLCAQEGEHRLPDDEIHDEIHQDNQIHESKADLPSSENSQKSVFTNGQEEC